MDKIYCVYSDDKSKFDVLELDVKDCTSKLILFEYCKELGRGQIEKESLEKIYILKNGRGSAIFTDKKRKIGSFVKLLSKKELLLIKERQRILDNFKKKIKECLKKYT